MKVFLTLYIMIDNNNELTENHQHPTESDENQPNLEQQIGPYASKQIRAHVNSIPEDEADNRFLNLMTCYHWEHISSDNWQMAYYDAEQREAKSEMEEAELAYQKLADSLRRVEFAIECFRWRFPLGFSTRLEVIKMEPALYSMTATLLLRTTSNLECATRQTP